MAPRKIEHWLQLKEEVVGGQLELRQVLQVRLLRLGRNLFEQPNVRLLVCILVDKQAL